MTVFTIPGWLQNAGTVHTAAQMRNYIGAHLAGTNGSVTSLVPRGGVHRDLGGQLGVSQTGSPSMAVMVDSGAAWVPGTEAAAQGAYGVVNDASVTLSITTAHATLPRIDIVQLRVRDSFYSGASNDALLDIKPGTPNASPTAPTPDANALVLAEVLVGAGVTSIVNANITSKRKWLTATGGVMQANLTADLPATTDVGTGQLVYNIQTGELVLFSGGVYNNVWTLSPTAVTSVAKDTATTEGTTTSTTFTNTLTTTGIRGTTFIAPPSGKVQIQGQCSTYISGTASSYLSIEVRTGGTIGSGGITLASDENTASATLVATANTSRHAVIANVTGLTPGTTYNACLTYRVSGSTGNYARRYLVVNPLPY